MFLSRMASHASIKKMTRERLAAIKDVSFHYAIVFGRSGHTMINNQVKYYIML